MESKKLSKHRVNWGIKDILLIFIAQLIFVFILCLLFLNTIKKDPFVGIFFLSIFTLILVSILLYCRNEKWSSLGFVKTNTGKLIVKGFIVGTVLFFITKLFFSPHSYIDLFTSRLTILKIFKCFLFLITFSGFVDILLVPFVEEILFRGLLYQALLNRYSKIMSIFIVSAFDSLTHIDSYQNFKWLLIRFVYFIFIARLFDKYRNLSICISAHSTLNYLAWIVQIVTQP